MKTQKAFMIVTKGGVPIVTSNHLPIYWLKKEAERKMGEFGGDRVVKVLINWEEKP